MHASLFTLALTVGVLAVPGRPASGQSVLDRSPNVSGNWTGPSGTLYFNFLHRFSVGDPPVRKVSNSPTFLLAYGLPSRTMIGLNYATSSRITSSAEPNEWAFFGRYAPLAESAGDPVDVGLQAGYNLAAESVDGELSVARRFGRVRVLAAARALSDAFGEGEARFSVAGGATLRVTDHIALAGDVGSLVDREDGEELAWGAGLQIAIPYTPHTLSLHATNTNTGTIQGVSRGVDQVRYGFEFTIPVTLSRYFGGSSPTAASATRVVAAPAGADTVMVSVKNLAFGPTQIEVAPGTTVVWTNGDPLPHTVTADDGSFDSGDIEPGASWSRTFTEPGRFAYHCTPHPFMKAMVVVREP